MYNENMRHYDWMNVSPSWNEQNASSGVGTHTNCLQFTVFVFL